MSPWAISSPCHVDAQQGKTGWAGIHPQKKPGQAQQWVMCEVRVDVSEARPWAVGSIGLTVVGWNRPRQAASDTIQLDRRHRVFCQSTVSR